MRRKYTFALLLTLALAVMCGAPADGAPTKTSVEEYVSFYGTYVNDGACKRSERVLEGEYRRSGGAFEARAVVRVAPFGGDCEQDSTTYRIQLERSFYAGGGWDMIVKFGASETAQTALYGATDMDGNVIAISAADSNPMYPVNLPVGVAKVVKAIVGLSHGTPVGELDFGFNIVPVAWSGNRGATQTFHTAWSHSFGEFDAGLNIDVGRSSFGDMWIAWGRGPATVKMEYSYGLNSISDGVPMNLERRYFLNTPVALAGADARDWRLAISVGIRWGL